VRYRPMQEDMRSPRCPGTRERSLRPLGQAVSDQLLPHPNTTSAWQTHPVPTSSSSVMKTSWGALALKDTEGAGSSR